jgi:hypothetical protein
VLRQLFEGHPLGYQLRQGPNRYEEKRYPCSVIAGHVHTYQTISSSRAPSVMLNNQ